MSKYIIRAMRQRAKGIGFTESIKPSLLYQLQQWLIKEYKLIIIIKVMVSNGELKYAYDLIDGRVHYSVKIETRYIYNTYEEALAFALDQGVDFIYSQYT